mgnify:CR=1 FL=1
MGFKRILKGNGIKMFSIRKNTFETNSSSTHCLAFDGKVNYDDQYLLNINGVITPYQDGDDIQYDEINIYTRPEDKIKWILTSLRQANYETDHHKGTHIGNPTKWRY